MQGIPHIGPEIFEISFKNRSKYYLNRPHPFQNDLPKTLKKNSEQSQTVAKMVTQRGDQGWPTNVIFGCFGAPWRPWGPRCLPDPPPVGTPDPSEPSFLKFLDSFLVDYGSLVIPKGVPRMDLERGFRTPWRPSEMPPGKHHTLQSSTHSAHGGGDCPQGTWTIIRPNQQLSIHIQHYCHNLQ